MGNKNEKTEIASDNSLKIEIDTLEKMVEEGEVKAKDLTDNIQALKDENTPLRKEIEALKATINDNAKEKMILEDQVKKGIRDMIRIERAAKGNITINEGVYTVLKTTVGSVFKKTPFQDLGEKTNGVVESLVRTWISGNGGRWQ